MAAALRILVVEDEMFVALDAEAILTAAGHEVVGMAASAAEGVAKATQLTPDLILMDIRLNGMRDGIDAAADIKRAQCVPIIFVTANADPVTHARAKQVGAAGLVSKPFTSQTLLAALAPFTAD